MLSCQAPTRLSFTSVSYQAAEAAPLKYHAKACLHDKEKAAGVYCLLRAVDTVMTFLGML